MPYMAIYHLKGDNLWHGHRLGTYKGECVTDCGQPLAPDLCYAWGRIGSVADMPDPPRDTLCPVCFPLPTVSADIDAL